MKKPDYRKGDVVVGAKGSGIARDCAFIAEYDPSETDGAGETYPGLWFYCFARADKYRKATVADLDAGIKMVHNEIDRNQKRLSVLLDLRDKVVCAAMSSQ